MRSTGTAYLMWLIGGFGLFGLHRFYCGKPLSGLLWMCTLGLFGWGAFFDLLLIPGMVTHANWPLLMAGGNSVNVQINNRNGSQRSKRRRAYRA